METLVHIEGLAIDFLARGGSVRALDGADLDVGSGERLGIVGESGSGKTTLAMAIGRMLPPNAVHAGGALLFDRRPIFAMDDAAIRELRRQDVGYVFQDPVGTLDPTMRIARQVNATMQQPLSRAALGELLLSVGLDDVERVARSYPHELSGGMAQRVSIAIAVARRPRLLIADEPTAALDASIRGQILELLIALSGQTGAALMLLSHDLRAISHHCDRVAVMYGGRIVEIGPSATIFRRPAHPYTRGLLQAEPGRESFGGVLEPIPGTPPVLRGPSHDCAFAPRCAWATERCRTRRPESREVAGRQVICFRAEEVLAPAMVVGTM